MNVKNKGEYRHHYFDKNGFEDENNIQLKKEKEEKTRMQTDNDIFQHFINQEDKKEVNGHISNNI